MPQVFEELWRSPGKTALQIIQEKDLGLVTDSAQLHSICQKVIDSHPDEVRTHADSNAITFTFKMLEFYYIIFFVFSLKVDAIRNGNKKVLNKLIGLVQRETKGRADPVLVRAILEEKTS